MNAGFCFAKPLIYEYYLPNIIVSGGWDNVIKIWDPMTGELIKKYQVLCNGS
jgi:WD40 repeat protein